MGEIICPLLTTRNVVERKEITGVAAVACVEERCAWWIEKNQKCAIAVIGQNVKR